MLANFFFYVISFALMLGVLVVVHEYGHYQVARWCGVKVLRFSFGFGKTLWRKRLGKDQTEWAISAFPLGGYVRMLDEREGEVAPHELHRTFNRQPVVKRMAIVVAGPLANLLLAVALNWGLFCYGIEEPRAIMGQAQAESMAEKAGIEDGERVLKVAGTPIETWQEFNWRLLQKIASDDTVELETLDSKNTLHTRHLNVALIREQGWEGDAFEKLGIRFFSPKIPPILAKVMPDSVAEQAGLQAGDLIRSINGELIERWQELVTRVMRSPGVPLTLEYERHGESTFIEITPSVFTKNGHEFGRIGAVAEATDFAYQDLMITVRSGPLDGLSKALNETWDKSFFTLRMIAKMLFGEVSWRNISGPVTIADYAGQSAKMGMTHYLSFMAMISISLAVLNLLPVPILDGGHLLYYVVEFIRRKPLSERSIEVGQKIGMVLMALLMFCAFYNDINRLISG